MASRIVYYCVEHGYITYTTYSTESIMPCRKCGLELEAVDIGGAFCSKCGDQYADAGICPKCGRELHTYDPPALITRICSKCGMTYHALPEYFSRVLGCCTLCGGTLQFPPPVYNVHTLIDGSWDNHDPGKVFKEHNEKLKRREGTGYDYVTPTQKIRRKFEKD